MRFVFRLFFRNPSFSVVAMLSLAAGVALTASLLSIADAILLRPLPVARPSEIVRIYTASAGQRMGFVSYLDFEDFRANSKTLAGMVAQTQVLTAVGGEGAAPAQVQMGLAVTPNYFSVLGVPVTLGRSFHAEDSHRPVTILAHAFWESHCSADRQWVGRMILIGGTAFTVIGVAPANFGLDRFLHEDFYVPIGVYEAGLLPSNGRPFENRAMRYLTVYGRLAQGATIRRARAELTALAARLEADYSDSNQGRKAAVLTEIQARMAVDQSMPVLAGLLLGLAAAVLGIACANVAGLMLLRADARARETAVRVAIGATRTRLLAESLAEGLLISAAGGALGIALAWVGTRLFIKSAAFPADIPMRIAARIDARVEAITLAAAALVALICAFAPWIAARKTNVAAVLKSTGARSGDTPSRSGGALVAIEIALAAALVGTGGLLSNRVIAAQELDLGYRIDHVLVLSLDPSQMRYGADRTRAFYSELLARVRRLPGVKAAALAHSVPLGHTGAQIQVVLENHQPATRDRLTVWVNTVSPGYFELMHVGMLAGRGFEERDTASSLPVVVVNEELAKQWNQPAGIIGERIRMNGRLVSVIGVARTTKYFGLHEPPRPFLYLPHSQNFVPRMVLHLETEGSPAGSIRAAVAEVRNLDRGMPVSEVRILNDDFVKGATFAARIGAQVLGTAGTCGLMLALAGVYGMVATAVAQRRREIGIRMALGAGRLAVVRLIVRDGIKFAGAGSLSGLSAAVAINRLLTSLMDGSSGSGQFHDLAVLTAAAIVVMTASLTASLIPALRASRADPAVALRET